MTCCSSLVRHTLAFLAFLTWVCKYGDDVLQDVFDCLFHPEDFLSSSPPQSISNSLPLLPRLQKTVVNRLCASFKTFVRLQHKSIHIHDTFHVWITKDNFFLLFDTSFVSLILWKESLSSLISLLTDCLSFSVMKSLSRFHSVFHNDTNSRCTTRKGINKRLKLIIMNYFQLLWQLLGSIMIAYILWMLSTSSNMRMVFEGTTVSSLFMFWGFHDYILTTCLIFLVFVANTQPVTYVMIALGSLFFTNGMLITSTSSSSAFFYER